MVQAVPSPRARAARQKLHPAWMEESNRLGRPLPSWMPQMPRITSAGACSRFPARNAAELNTFWIVVGPAASVRASACNPVAPAR